MGKNSRERKMIKLEQAESEKQRIEQRRQERLTPVYRSAKKLTITVLLTIILLYLGVTINERLPDIASKLLGKGL